MSEKTTGVVIGATLVGAGLAKAAFEEGVTPGTFVTLCSGALLIGGVLRGHRVDGREGTKVIESTAVEVES